MFADQDKRPMILVILGTITALVLLVSAFWNNDEPQEVYPDKGVPPVEAPAS